jgi:hypothetical protein
MARNKNNQNSSSALEAETQNSGSALEAETQNSGSGFEAEARESIPAENFPQEPSGALPGGGDHPDVPPEEQPPVKPETPKPPEKRRVYHAELKGKTIIAGSDAVAFNAEGFAEVDPAQAAYLLSIPGYTEA